jgi:hypothetical protein
LISNFKNFKILSQQASQQQQGIQQLPLYSYGNDPNLHYGHIVTNLNQVKKWKSASSIG